MVHPSNNTQKTLTDSYECSISDYLLPLKKSLDSKLNLHAYSYSIIDENGLFEITF